MARQGRVLDGIMFDARKYKVKERVVGTKSQLEDKKQENTTDVIFPGQKKKLESKTEYEIIETQPGEEESILVEEVDIKSIENGMGFN